MTSQIDFYIDENETIYVSDKAILTITPGNKGSLLSGFQYIGELIGQSTCFVNKVRFHVSGWIDPDGSDLNDTRMFMLAGVVPYQNFTTSNAPGKLEDYQELKGFPLKGCYGYSSSPKPRDSAVPSDNWQQVNNYFTWSRTYKPRTALLLSRLQEFCFTVYNESASASDIKALSSIEIQFKRGD